MDIHKVMNSFEMKEWHTVIGCYTIDVVCRVVRAETKDFTDFNVS